MNVIKEYERLKCDNIEYKDKIRDLEFQLFKKDTLNNHGYEKAKNMIIEIESLRQELKKTILDAKKKSSELDQIILELNELKKVMVSLGYNVPFKQKVKMKINKLLHR